MKGGPEHIVGKLITGVVVASSPNDPKNQLFLTFSDGTYFEIWGAAFSCASALDQGGAAAAIAYASKNGGKVTATYGEAGA